ncbi:MAG: nucleoside triphosphate pyrophosphohydrolase [Thermoanaerobaculia bacterium]|nr:nucleoside triphosphate pyrophosphohydrolase [Thermoanaerobaculia bacterium]
MKEGPGSLRRLADLVARLRQPDGCPWDREQTLNDLRAYLLEEAHEVAAAIDSGAGPELAEELGDLAFLVAFVARLAEEKQAFTLESVLAGAEAKIVSRHPHVFAGDRLDSAEEVRRAWEERKARRRARGDSLLSGVPATLPALVSAYRITQKAAGVGFDWPDPPAVLDKLVEEGDELRELLEGDAPPTDRVREEVGDLLFTAANLARKLGIDPESALAAANAKFRHRFRRLEEELMRDGIDLAAATPEQMEAAWERVKTAASAGRPRPDPPGS